MTSGLRVAMWSGPRNISTAMMRAWENREDTVVVDEPLYAHYLLKTGVDHPGREEVMASQASDWHVVAKTLTGPIPGGKPVWYQKHMTQHVLGRHATRLAGWSRATVSSSVAPNKWSRPSPSSGRMPLPGNWVSSSRRVSSITSVSGRVLSPPVLDAEDVLKDPKAMLSLLCSRLGIGFSERMLHWPAGPRASDGVWAPHWYHAVVRSTGFEPYRAQEPRLDPFQARLAEHCQPYYERLVAHRLKAP